MGRKTPKGFGSVSNEYKKAYEEGPEALKRFKERETRDRRAAVAKKAAGKKDTAPTAAQRATAAGKRRNERAKRLAAERAREAAAKAKKKPTTFKQRMKARGLAAVTREQLAAWEKQTGKKGLRAYLNAKGKLPEVKEVVSPVKRGPPSGRGEVDPLLEIDLSNRTGFKALGKRKTAPSPTARRATEEGRRRNLIQQASAQGFSKGGAVNKSRGTGAAETGTGFQGVF